MNIHNRPIGVFDSGIGGLTAVSELKKILPNEDIIYLGDTARVPYGTKSCETVLRYAAQDIAFLKKHEVKIIIVACGTVSSVMAGEEGVFEGCTGVISPAVNAAAACTKNKKIGVIATSASIKSRSYERLIKKVMPEAEVFCKACPMFVPLVENGYTDRGCEPTVAIAKEYLLPLRKKGIDTLILGCTHYPLISGIISDIMGEGVTLISSGGEAARFAKKLLAEKGLLTDRSGTGRISLYCTDSAELFRESAAHFLNLNGISVENCAIE